MSSLGQSSSLHRLHNVEKVSRSPPTIALPLWSPDCWLPLNLDAAACLFVPAQRIVRVLELAGSVMEELGNAQGPRAEAVAAHCREFMLSMKEIQTTLREEIKSACEYRPFEKCDYSARIANEICCKKLEYVIEKMDAMQLNIEDSTNEV
uniref:Uncharacterized protein n=3 Tax=Avena sativa TaxID=4498 RepID=A0ACD5ZCJ3_AVESA